jgi:hypothetical protein
MGRFRTVSRGSVLALALLSVSGPALAQETVTYAYDALGRLVAVGRSGAQSGNVSTTYSYDSAGNRTNASTQGSWNSGSGGGSPGGPGSGGGGPGSGPTNFAVVPVLGGAVIFISQ